MSLAKQNRRQNLKNNHIYIHIGIYNIRLVRLALGQTVVLPYFFMRLLQLVEGLLGCSVIQY